MAVEDFFSGHKFGSSGKGSSGGIVTWGFAPAGAGAFLDISADLDEPYYKEQLACAFDVWESLINIDFRFVGGDAATMIDAGWIAANSALPANYLAGTAISDRPAPGLDLVTQAEIGFDAAVDWVHSLNDDAPGTVSMAAFMLDAIANILGMHGAPDAASIFAGDALRPSAGDIAVMRAIYGSSGKSLTPTSGANTLLGTFGTDTLNGLGGNDDLKGYGGNDALIGGDGADRLDGGTGNDLLQGGTGDDSLEGGIGNDNVQGGSGNDAMNGSFGQDSMDGGGGADNLRGGYGNDVMLGGTGNDILSGEVDDDRLAGGDGNDRLAGGRGFDNLTGGLGADVFIFAQGDAEDWVMDFTNGTDKLDLSSFGFADFAAARATAHQFEGTTVFDLPDGDKLKLIGFKIALLDAGDLLL